MVQASLSEMGESVLPFGSFLLDIPIALCDPPRIFPNQGQCSSEFWQITFQTQ